ncbi:PilZ domain-containing protein [Candidatus Halobeggiatoa sp. HSG11]|nr:PilZ domain-containing protein [Candidatus Halobeggiatoa sp. HSG11]
MSNKLRRKFIRHPTHIPIKVGYVNDEYLHNKEYLNNVSLGGIAFESDSYWKPDTIISINILNNTLQFNGKVAWCRQNKNYFDVGVEFITELDSTKDVDKKEGQIESYKQMLIDIGECDQYYII